MYTKLWKHGLLGCLALMLVACGQQKVGDGAQQEQQEDMKAKHMLQGLWMNADDEEPAMHIKGDTIYYPDSTSIPVAFQIFGDTLVLHGMSDVCYAIVRQSENLFEFSNQAGDVVKLVKCNDAANVVDFPTKPMNAINQNRLIKRDTIVMAGDARYHCYVQVNPTTYKVYKTTYNDDGISVDNIYFDNIINLAIYNGTRKVFSSDFHKADFSKHIEEKELRQCILNDMLFNRADKEGIHYDAVVGIPDSPSGYVIDVLVDYGGKVSFRR